MRKPGNTKGGRSSLSEKRPMHRAGVALWLCGGPWEGWESKG